LLCIAPLLILYEVGVYLRSPAETSWAGNLLPRLLFRLFGRRGHLFFNLMVVGALIVAGLVVRRRGEVRLRYFPFVVGEGFLYALSFGSVVLLLLRGLLPLAIGAPVTPDPVNEVIIAAGAGVYEEILFRLLLMSGLFWFLQQVIHLARAESVVASVLLSSFLFALFHYMGTENFELAGFAYRFLAGVICATIFLCRGLGVVVYTHAFYNMLLEIAP